MLRKLLTSIKVLVLSIVLFVVLILFVIPQTSSFTDGLKKYEEHKQEIIERGGKDTPFIKKSVAIFLAVKNEKPLTLGLLIFSILLAFSMIKWLNSTKQDESNSISEFIKNVLSNIFLFTFAVFLKRSSKQLSYYFDMPARIKFLTVIAYLFISLTMIFLFNINDIDGINIELIILSYFKFILLPLLVLITLFSKKFQKNYQNKLLWITVVLLVIDTIFGGYIGFRLGQEAMNNNTELSSLTNALNPGNYLLSIIIVTAFSLYAELIKYAVIRKQSVEAELKLAENLQKELIPEIELNNDILEVFGKSEAAEEVGGDYIDFIELDSNRSVLAVADVSGHNAVAGLLMSMLKTAFRTELKYEKNPAKIATSLNQTIFQNKNKKMFISFLFGIIDTNSSSLEFINAGHPPLLHYSSTSGSITEHRTGDLALGLLEEHNFKPKTITFQNNDVVILFSDGIIENRNNNNIEWGIDGLKKLIINSAEKNAKEIYKSILTEMKNYSSSKLIDDITLLVVKIK